ncbi:MAG: hypothetical protein RL538_340 [Candidatus Parcubacteria bacterium]|jgi:hypothetical protein
MASKNILGGVMNRVGIAISLMAITIITIGITDVFLDPAPDLGKSVTFVAEEESADSYAGRIPSKRIVYQNGECAGVLFEDNSYDGDCDMARVGSLPTVGYDELFPLDRMPLD